MNIKKPKSSQPADDLPPAEPQEGQAEPSAFDPQALETLRQELDAASAKAAENFDGWQRERADFLNYKKRIEREQAQAAQNMTGGIVKKYLVVLDDMERALKHAPEANGDVLSWVNGIELIYRKLQNILEAEGVLRIDADGQFFDPNLHEAISHEDSPDHESGQVIEVLQQGYVLGDRVLRPALVRVAR
jgi:molecular chaperone GrpE